MRRPVLILVLALLAAVLLVPAVPAAASDVSINNAVAKRSGKLNKLANGFNDAVRSCNDSKLRSCASLFRSAKKLRTATIRTARAIKGERSSSKLGAEAKRTLLKSFKAQRISVESAPKFIRASRSGQTATAERLRKRGARYGRIARRNARLAQKLLERLANG